MVPHSACEGGCVIITVFKCELVKFDFFQFIEIICPCYRSENSTCWCYGLNPRVLRAEIIEKFNSFVGTTTTSGIPSNDFTWKQKWVNFSFILRSQKFLKLTIIVICPVCTVCTGSINSISNLLVCWCPTCLDGISEFEIKNSEL